MGPNLDAIGSPQLQKTLDLNLCEKTTLADLSVNFFVFLGFSVVKVSLIVKFINLNRLRSCKTKKIAYFYYCTGVICRFCPLAQSDEVGVDLLAHGADPTYEAKKSSYLCLC